MSKLFKRFTALGDLTQYTYDDFVAACGEPKERKPALFSDIGEGTRATWSDGIFVLTLNFSGEGKYCGIYHHRNWEPYIWLGAVTVFIIAFALIGGAMMRARAANAELDASGVIASLTESMDTWKTDGTAGICLADLDFDGTPELLATDAEFAWDDELAANYFGPSDVSVYTFSDDGLVPAGAFTTDEYCFTATIHRYTDAQGSTGWYCPTGDGLLLLSLSDGSLTVSGPVSGVDTTGGDTSVRLLRNEAWVNPAGAAATAETVKADIAAVAADYFENT